MNTRQQLRDEIIDTKQRFHKLLDRVSDEALHLPSDNPAWSIGQVFYHMSLAPRLLIADVRLFIKPRRLYLLVLRLFPGSLFNWINSRWTRYGARHLSRQFLADEYDKAHELALAALDSVGDEDLKKTLVYPDWDPMLRGEVSMERLFHYLKDHFDSHASQIDARLTGLRLPTDG